MTSIAEFLRFAADELRQAGIPEPAREARLLLTLATGKDDTFLIAHPESELGPEDVEEARRFVARRAGSEPFQLIAGRQEFYGIPFKVTRDVMIPRPETEILVEEALRIIDPIACPRVCDVGTGSGCIPVAILRNNEGASAVAIDLSEAALKIASENAASAGIASRITFVHSDCFAEVADEKFDLIASNPPYVPAAVVGSLQAEVREFEPRMALTDEADGLRILSRIIESAPDQLVPGGFLLLEIGWDQSERVAALFDERVWSELAFLPDLQGIPRIVKAKFAGV